MEIEAWKTVEQAKIHNELYRQEENRGEKVEFSLFERKVNVFL
jgi:hypothetical protein